jgi:crotonobetainyl-CoA:carnitine CoA-transferase CaiB-like acyl-CoA transferase
LDWGIRVAATSWKDPALVTAFEGLRVVDLSDRLSGAFASRLFGDFGADVVLVEPPTGHVLRREPPFAGDVQGLERSAVHAGVNWNKRSVVTDDPDALSRLVAGADVVVTNGNPVTEGRWAAALEALGPDGIHLSITPHGLTSPLAGLPGNELTANARSGWSYINGYRDEPPLRLPGYQAGYVGGLAGFVAAAAALLRRHGTDEAERVDISELEAFALTVHPWGVAAIYNGASVCYGPTGRRPRGEQNPLFTGANGQMSMAVAYFHQWTAAMDVLGLPDLGLQEDLVVDVGRHSRDLSVAFDGIARTLPGLDCWPVFHALAQLRCPVGVLQEIDRLVDDEQFAARGFLVETTIEGRTVRAPGPLARFEPPLWRLSRPAPRLDEDGPAIRAEAARPRVEARPFTPVTPDAIGAGPLHGVRVLSLGQAWSGTFATELLAFLGADVVQIGALDRHDSWRRVGTGVPGAVIHPGRVQHALNTQGLYNSVNLNKREMTLDLGSEEGRKLFWQLLPRFDILVDNFRPTVLPAWGVTVEALGTLRTGLIWASLSGYGANGPYQQYPAIGSTIEPMSGLSSLLGYDGDLGMNTGGLYPDPVSGYGLAAAILAALHRRDRTGSPDAQRIDLSMMEAVATTCGDAIVGYDATGRVPRRAGNHHPRVAPHNFYRARPDGWLAVAADDDAAWKALVAHIGDGRLTDGRFATMAARKANETALDEIMAEWCLGQDAAEAETALGAIGISAARVVPLYEIYSRPDPNLLATGFITAVDHPEAGVTWLPGRPWRFSAAPSTPVTAAPCIGQHSAEVLAEELGIGPDEYGKLVASGVTGTLDDAGLRL